MANVAHSTLTGAHLHETKGASTAAADTVHKANGSGVTSWAKIVSANIDTASIFNVNQYTILPVLPDISTVSSIYVAFPFACTINRIEGCLQGAIITADSIVTFKNQAGASMGTMTVAFTGSAAGDVDTLSPSTNNTFAAGERMTITTDGGSANTVAEFFTIRFTRTA